MNTKLLSFIANRNDTPSYIFDIESLVERIQVIRERMPKVKLCYAMKANPFLVHELQNHVDYYEVCSPGEFQICVLNNILADKIILSGVNKEPLDIEKALLYGVRVFTVESLQQAILLQQSAQNHHCVIQAILRLTSGNQFGINMEDIESIISDKKYKDLDITGIQYYSGTQKNTKKILEELDMLSIICQKLDSKIGKTIHLEYGPGFAVDYYKESDSLLPLNECCGAINNITVSRKTTLEMGRFLVADCGYYITKVMDIKENDGCKYCIVDGGINHINYYGQVMGAKKPPISVYKNFKSGYKKILANSSDGSINICGSLCTVADVLVRNLPINDIDINDLIIFEKIGAYSVTEGIFLFLSRAMPKVYFYTHNKLLLVRDAYESFTINTTNTTTTGDINE